MSFPDSIEIKPRWGRRVVFLILGGSLVAFVAYDRVVHADRFKSDFSRYHSQSFRVVNVVDGDTFDIAIPDRGYDNTRIRLWGVDTPELEHSALLYSEPRALARADDSGPLSQRDSENRHTKTKNALEKDDAPAMHFGLEAKVFTEQTLLDRTVYVVLVPSRTRDKYGRLLAYVFLDRDGPLFNEMLIEQGFGYADFRFRHPYRRRFEAFDKSARRAGRGLWEGITLEQMPEWRQRFEWRRTEPRP